MSDDGGVDDGSLARTRGRRTRQDKNGRLAALEKLKSSRQSGQKHKYEVKEMENVYDVVDEREYSKKVLERQQDDWIIDDGTGYVEDGREIFDDDMQDDEGSSRRNRKGPKSKRDKEEEKAQKEVHKQGFGALEKMFSNMSSMPQKKRKRAEAAPEASAGNDDFEDLMAELQSEKKSSSVGIKKSSETIMKKIAAPSFEMYRAPKVTRHQDEEADKWRKPGLKKFKPATSGIDSPGNYASSVPGSSKSRFSEPSPPSYGNDEEDLGGFDGAFDDPMDFNDDPVEVPEVPEEKPKIPVQPKKTALEKTLPKNNTVSNASSANGLPEGVTVKVEPETSKNFHMDEDLSEFFNEDEANDLSGGEGQSSSTAAPAMVSEGSGGKSLNFYWLDVFEEPKNPGVLFMFGKVKTPPPGTGYSSCCLVVKNLHRTVFVLPRETTEDGTPVNYMDVYNEFNTTVTAKYKITSFKSKKSKKKYCFDIEGIPPVAEYMEVRYSGTLPSLPQDVSGETFSHVFGTNTPLMETFLLEKKLKGPCWLQISNCEQVSAGAQQSWSKFEFTCEEKGVQIHPEGANLPPPTLVLVSLNLQAVNDPAAKKDSIIFAGVSVNKNFLLQSPIPPNGIYHDFFCLLNKPPGEVWPLDVDRVTNKRTLKMDSERSMLGCLLAKLHQLDPDVYLGHDLNFELLMLQLLHFKVPHWSRIGRLKRSTPITKNNKLLDFRAALAGRLVCDVKISAMELIRARSYDLPSLASQVLGMKEDQVATLTGPEMKQLFDSSEGLRSFVNWGMQHCVLNIRLINELQVMPLAVQITCIAGNTLSRTLLGGRSERNEYLLLHAFNSKDFIVPDKFKPFANQKNIKKEPTGADGAAEEGEDDKKGKSSSGPSYSGGLVLAPKKGFYDDYIVLMDFNSLYPSIIQEFNVCFTTNVTEDDSNCSADDEQRGILPEEIRKLVESRKQVKSLMKASNVSEDQMRQYDIRQKALKLTANSMYGCLGFRMSRFYAKNLAAYITGKGRDILMKTKEAVEKMGFEVIYGDTDSLMINTHSQDISTVYQIGNKIKNEINRTYKLLELEIDGVFRFLLLLKKKKYAALLYNPKASGESEYVLELKGLDMVRRDWAPIASNTARSCLNEIMTEQPLDDKIYKVCKILTDVGNQLREGAVPMKELLITKQLAKNPEEYKEASGQYHVAVALRMNKSGKLPKKYRNGDTVSYLFCTDGLPHHLIEMNSSPVVKKEEKENNDEDGVKKEQKEAEKQEPLKPDAVYYLAHQVHPVVSRICDPIPGLDPARIAESLGLDASSYKRKRTIEDSNNEDKYLGQTEAEKYNSCEKFTFDCAKCHMQIALKSALFTSKDGSLKFSLETCPHCNENPWNNTPRFKNQLTLFMRKFIAKYYKNSLTCEDPSCTNASTAVPLHLERGYPICSCRQALMYKEFSDSQLYRQLNYLHYVFDLTKAKKDLKKDERTEIQRRLDREKDKKGNPGELESIYNSLQAFVNKTLSSSAYSHIELGKLYQLVSSSSSRKLAVKSG